MPVKAAETGRRGGVVADPLRAEDNVRPKESEKELVEIAIQPTEPEKPRVHLSIDELARRQGVKLGRPIEDFYAPHLWESDEEVDQFIRDTYEARRRDARF